MSDAESIIGTYGYLVLFLGTLLGGQPVLILAGVAARMGHLKLPWVVLIATVGGMGGYHVYFYLGRRHAQRILRRFPRLEGSVGRFRVWLDNHNTVVILVSRFLYGFRAAAPVAVGMSGMSVPRFVLLNAIGAIIWAVFFAGLGYVFGAAAEQWLGDLRRYEWRILGGIAVLGGIWWLVRHIRRRRRRAK